MGSGERSCGWIGGDVVGCVWGLVWERKKRPSPPRQSVKFIVWFRMSYRLIQRLIKGA
jgi:hypothetical protein